MILMLESSKRHTYVDLHKDFAKVADSFYSMILL